MLIWSWKGELRVVYLLPVIPNTPNCLGDSVLFPFDIYVALYLLLGSKYEVSLGDEVYLFKLIS